MFLLIIRNLRYRHIRSYLTILGIVIGVTLILSLFLLGDGLKRAVAAQLAQFGEDLIYIFPGKEENSFVGMFSGQTLRDKDVEIIKSVPGVELALIMNTDTVTASFKGEEKSSLLHGSPWRETKILFTASQGFRFQSGDWPVKDTANEIVLGARTASSRFKEKIKTGDTLVIRGRRFEVKGVLAEIGEPTTDAMIYASLNRFRIIIDRPTGVNSLAVKVGRGYDIDSVAVQIKSELKKQKGIEDFVVLTSEKAGRLIGDILGIVQIVVLSIAGVALFVGGVGIMNTMYTSVLERTREIGVFKSLGATSRWILLMFLVESGIMGALGGILGVLFGAGFVKFVEILVKRAGFVFMQIDLSPTMIAGVAMFAFIFGAFCGTLPAWQASRLKPTEALRYE